MLQLSFALESHQESILIDLEKPGEYVRSKVILVEVENEEKSDDQGQHMDFIPETPIVVLHRVGRDLCSGLTKLSDEKAYQIIHIGALTNTLRSGQQISFQIIHIMCFNFEACNGQHCLKPMSTLSPLFYLVLLPC